MGAQDWQKVDHGEPVLRRDRGRPLRHGSGRVLAGEQVRVRNDHEPDGELARPGEVQEALEVLPQARQAALEEALADGSLAPSAEEVVGQHEERAPPQELAAVPAQGRRALHPLAGVEGDGPPARGEPLEGALHVPLLEVVPVPEEDEHVGLELGDELLRQRDLLMRRVRPVAAVHDLPGAPLGVQLLQETLEEVRQRLVVPDPLAVDEAVAEGEDPQRARRLLADLGPAQTERVDGDVLLVGVVVLMAASSNAAVAGIAQPRVVCGRISMIGSRSGRGAPTAARTASSARLRKTSRAPPATSSFFLAPPRATRRS